MKFIILLITNTYKSILDGWNKAAKDILHRLSSCSNIPLPSFFSFHYCHAHANALFSQSHY